MTIPKEILVASQTNDFIIFIGAGFSKQLGFKDWNQLAKQAIDEFLLEYPDVVLLKQCLNKNILDEILVFDALHRINSHKIETIIQESNNIDIDKNKLGNHELLWDISSRIITTNYDKALENAKPKTSIQTICHNYKHEVANNFDKPAWLYHIHGIVDDIRDCVIFTKNYVELYNDRNPAVNQLKSILQNKTILFVGFSMNDRYVSKVLENLNILFENSNSHKRFILLSKDEVPSQKYLTKLEIKNYEEAPAFLAQLRDEIKRYSKHSQKISVLNRHRCYSFQLGSNEFNTLLSNLLNDPVSTESSEVAKIDGQIDLLQSSYEKSIVKAVHYESLGQIEKIVGLLKDKQFRGQEEFSRMLYLALAYEKLNYVPEAIELLESLASRLNVSREILLCAKFNMSLCYEKLNEYSKVYFEDFFEIEDNLQFSKERIKDKAIANHLIVCLKRGEPFIYEDALNEVLENSLKGSPKLYCKTLLNYLTYKKQGISKEEYNRISELTTNISINSRVGILCEVYMKLDEETQKITKEEILYQLDNIVAGNSSYTTDKHIQELKKYIASKFSN